MPTSAPGTWTNNRRHFGFTLLEVMVTIVLIGIIASFAVLSLRGSDAEDHLAREAQRLTTLLQLNREEAIIQGEQRGIRFTEGGYTLLTRNEEGEWHTLDDSTLSPTHRLGPEFALQLWVEGQPVALSDAPDTPPQVLFLSSGEATEFQVLLRLTDNATRDYRVSGDLVGALTLESTR